MPLMRNESQFLQYRMQFFIIVKNMMFNVFSMFQRLTVQYTNVVKKENIKYAGSLNLLVIKVKFFFKLFTFLTVCI